MGITWSNKEFHRRITATFSCCLSTEFQLLKCHIVGCIQFLSSVWKWLHMSEWGWYTCQRSTVNFHRTSEKWSSLFSSRSFFSGHTAPVFCKEICSTEILFFPHSDLFLVGFGFLIMYIHVSWSWRHLGILGHLFQVGIAILGLYIGNEDVLAKFL